MAFKNAGKEKKWHGTEILKDTPSLEALEGKNKVRKPTRLTLQMIQKKPGEPGERAVRPHQKIQKNKIKKTATKRSFLSMLGNKAI